MKNNYFTLTLNKIKSKLRSKFILLTNINYHLKSITTWEINEKLSFDKKIFF